MGSVPLNACPETFRGSSKRLKAIFAYRLNYTFTFHYAGVPEMKKGKYVNGVCFICFPNIGLHHLTLFHICSSGGHLTRGSTALQLLNLRHHLKPSALSGVGQAWHLNDFLCRYLNGFFWLVHKYSKCQNEKKKKETPTLPRTIGIHEANKDHSRR